VNPHPQSVGEVIDHDHKRCAVPDVQALGAIERGSQRRGRLARANPHSGSVERPNRAALPGEGNSWLT
jgi:hypothetical protein